MTKNTKNIPDLTPFVEIHKSSIRFYYGFGIVIFVSGFVVSLLCNWLFPFLFEDMNFMVSSIGGGIISIFGPLYQINQIVNLRKNVNLLRSLQFMASNIDEYDSETQKKIVETIWKNIEQT